MLWAKGLILQLKCIIFNYERVCWKIHFVREKNCLWQGILLYSLYFVRDCIIHNVKFAFVVEPLTSCLEWNTRKLAWHFILNLYIWPNNKCWHSINPVTWPDITLARQIDHWAIARLIGQTWHTKIHSFYNLTYMYTHHRTWPVKYSADTGRIEVATDGCRVLP